MSSCCSLPQSYRSTRDGSRNTIRSFTKFEWTMLKECWIEFRQGFVLLSNNRMRRNSKTSNEGTSILSSTSPLFIQLARAEEAYPYNRRQVLEIERRARTTPMICVSAPRFIVVLWNRSMYLRQLYWKSKGTSSYYYMYSSETENQPYRQLEHLKLRDRSQIFNWLITIWHHGEIGRDVIYRARTRRSRVVSC